MGRSGVSIVEQVGQGVPAPASWQHRHRIRTSIGRHEARLARSLGLAPGTKAQRMVLEVAARTYWLLAQVDCVLMDHGLKAIDQATRSLLHERSILADRLHRGLSLLGRARGPLASTPTTTAPRAASPSSKAKRKGSGKAKDSAIPDGTP